MLGKYKITFHHINTDICMLLLGQGVAYMANRNMALCHCHYHYNLITMPLNIPGSSPIGNNYQSGDLHHHHYHSCTNT